MTILYETIRKILHFLTSTIWYLMEPNRFYMISTWLSKPWLCWLDGEVATLQSPLIMAGPPGWSDCGPLATWAGNEWVVVSTLCYIIKHYSLIWQKLRGWIFTAKTLYIFFKKATTMVNIQFWSILHSLVWCTPRDWIFIVLNSYFWFELLVSCKISYSAVFFFLQHNLANGNKLVICCEQCHTYAKIYQYHIKSLNLKNFCWFWIQMSVF